tara:strand:- start:1100 stop:1867 length:768 start_codon:yes stop_codon:yes gene_type:complete
MTAKWKQIESYHDSKAMHESKFNINKKQAQMILDLKKDELKKMRFLAMLDIDKDEVKQLAKKDPSIMKAIGRQGGSFRTSLVRKRANEDAPTVHTGPAIAGTGDDSSTVVVRKKKKKKGILIGGDKPMSRLDGRTKAYKQHARKLQAQRERRQKLRAAAHCENFTKSLKEKFSDFSREEFIVEDNVAILRKIVKDKRNMPVKLKDGQMKVDLYTASAFVQTLDKITNPSTKKKLEFIINKGNKSQFLRAVDVIFK